MTTRPNHALQRTRHERRGCNRGVPRAGSLSLGRSAKEAMATLDQLLLFSARSGNLSLVEGRIAAGADVRYSATQYGSALLQAVRSHHHKIVELLLSHGADVRSVDSHGEGALEYALHLGDDSMVTLLLSAGARLQPHALPRYREMLTASLARSGKKTEPNLSAPANRHHRPASNLASAAGGG